VRRLAVVSLYLRPGIATREDIIAGQWVAVKHDGWSRSHWIPAKPVGYPAPALCGRSPDYGSAVRVECGSEAARRRRCDACTLAIGMLLNRMRSQDARRRFTRRTR
jgi:hypothetical protein